MVKISTHDYSSSNLYLLLYLDKKSKRVSCAHRYSIAKKVRAHNKKMRKEALKHPEHKSTYVLKVPIYYQFQMFRKKVERHQNTEISSF